MFNSCYDTSSFAKRKTRRFTVPFVKTSNNDTWKLRKMLPLFTYNSDPPSLITTEVHQTPQQSGAREFHASFSSCGFCPFPPNHLALPTALALLVGIYVSIDSASYKLEQKVGRAQNAAARKEKQNLD